MHIRLPREIKEFASRLRDAGFQCFLVGGAIRDLLLGRPVKDFDLATDALPRQVMNVFSRVIPTGIQHGTVTVLYKSLQLEVTTFRVDGKYEDFRRPKQVEYAATIFEDLKRRDFTINALAYDLLTGELLDPFHGRTDLKKKIIRAIGDPLERFKEDALRTLRACRFACAFDFTIEKNTMRGIADTAALIKKISGERVRDELIKILETRLPSRGFELLTNTGLLHFIIPELESCRDIKQPSMHCFDVYFHSLYSCDAAPADNLTVRLASLLHDVGKPLTETRNAEGDLRFFGHEKKSGELAERILKRLKFPNAVISGVRHLILHHMFSYDDSWSDAAVRRFLRRVGTGNIDDLFLLRMADQVGMCNRPVSKSALERFKERINDVLSGAAVLSLTDLCIDGNDIMRELGIGPGEQVGRILEYLLEAVLDDPAQNTRETLLTLARNFFDTRLKPFVD
jgi:tRNA nucleotidyltransferase (CCA-adding enzyme)